MAVFLRSPKRRLSDLLSPSELLDNPLDFDDVDQALNETGNTHKIISRFPTTIKKIKHGPY